jgi:hypothetical protein
MARYTETLRDQNLRAIPGALVSVTAMDGTTAVLTDDSAQHLDNPFLTDAYGNYTFNTSAGIYTISFTYGGRTILKEVVTAGTLIANLAPDPANAGKFIALDADGVPTYSSGTGADAGLRTDLAGDGIPLVGGLGDALLSRPTTVSTIAAMKALPKSGLVNGQIVKVTGYASPLDGGGGEFYWHSSTTATADDGLIFAADGGGVGRWLRNYDFGQLSSRYFGILGVGDETTKIDTFINTLAIDTMVFPFDRYYVTSVSLDTKGRTIDFQGSLIIGQATTETGSIVAIRGGLAWLGRLRIAANFNLNYECGLHWYTNRIDLTNENYPGFLNFDFLQIEACEIGLNIGALPSQVTLGGASDILADGLAIDAPLSESVISNLKITNCVIGINMRQPNGKVTLMAPQILSEMDTWTAIYGYATPERATALAISDPGSELTIIGGTLNHVQGGANGNLISSTGGRITLSGTILETTVPCYLDGETHLAMHQLLNAGANFVDRPFIQVGPNMVGTISITSMPIIRPARTAELYDCEVVKSLAGFNLGFLPNPRIIANFASVEFRDCPWRMGSTYQPIVRGVRAKFSQCQLTAYNALGVRTLLLRINDGPDRLAGVVDRTYKTIAAYPQTTSVADGGITFATSGAGSQWGIETTGLPVVEDLTFYAWLRLTAGATGTMSAETAKARCNPSEAHIVRGFIKTGATTATLKIQVKYWDYDGVAAATASFDLFNGQESQFGTVAQPMIFYFVPPADADQFSIKFEVQNAADCRVTLVEVG